MCLTRSTSSSEPTVATALLIILSPRVVHHMCGPLHDPARTHTLPAAAPRCQQSVTAQRQLFPFSAHHRYPSPLSPLTSHLSSVFEA
jgi:hypothetical protein